MSYTLWIEWHDRAGWEPFSLAGEEPDVFTDLTFALSVGRGLIEDEPELDSVEVRDERRLPLRRLRRTPTGIVTVTPVEAAGGR